MSGLPFTIVKSMSIVFFKTLNMDNELIAVFTNALYIPWTFKLFWAPLIDLYKTRRFWIIATQAVLILAAASLAVAVFVPHNIPLLIGIFAIMAMASATQDIAIDGYYLDVLDNHQQAFYVGVRNAAYKVAWLLGSGGLVELAGEIAERTHGPNPVLAGWGTAFAVCSILFAVFCFFHARVLPFGRLDDTFAAVESPTGDRRVASELAVNAELAQSPDKATLGIDAASAALSASPATTTRSSSSSSESATADAPSRPTSITAVFKAFPVIFKDFLDQPKIHIIILYVLIFRLGDALLMTMAQPFLIDPVTKGGLGLSIADVGKIYGLVGTFFLLLGGMLGGALISRNGLKRYIMAFAIIQNISLLLYWFLAIHKSDLILVACVNAFEQFSYGLGTSSYTVFLLSTVKPKYKASQYAIVTAFMALGVMLPGMISGYLTTKLGYANFFLLSFFVSLPGIITIPYLPMKELAAQRTKA